MRQLLVYGLNYIWNGFDFYQRILGHGLTRILTDKIYYVRLAAEGER